MNSMKKNQESKIYGRRAVESLFKARPQDLIRLYLLESLVFEQKELIRYFVEQKLAYHIVTESELEAITKATHHEGLCVIAKNKKMRSIEEVFSAPGRKMILALEEVENPHNLGAMMRSCAHFGVDALIYLAKVPVAQSASAQRTAEGGAESIDALQVENWSEVFKLAQKYNYVTCATSSHHGESIYSFTFPEKTLLFMGSEGEGLSKSLQQKMKKSLQIPGTGKVESLNVTTATTTIVAEWYRQSL